MGAAALVSRGEARLAGSFEAGLHGREARRDVVLGEAEEGSLGAKVGGFEVLGDLIEGLADAGVVAAHGR